MPDTVAEISLALVVLYLVLGALAAVAMHAKGLRAVEPSVSAGAPWGFRMAITPGLIALWPMMLARWRAAAAGRRVPAEADAPVAAERLRRRHRLLATALLVVVPGLVALAVVSRPAAPVVEPSARGLLPEPPPLPTVTSARQRPFDGVPVDLAVRSDGSGALQLELEVDGDLEIPSVVAYWSAGRLADAPEQAVFLGAVWGPGTRRMALPAAAAHGGVVTLHSLGWREPVGETELETAARPGTGGR